MRLIDVDALEPDAEYDDGKYWAYSRTQIENAPTIEPERAHGHWVHRGCGVFECDQCGKLVSTNVYKIEKVSDSFKFCPECGLDMRGDQECSHC